MAHGSSVLELVGRLRDDDGQLQPLMHTLGELSSRVQVRHCTECPCWRCVCVCKEHDECKCLTKHLLPVRSFLPYIMRRLKYMESRN